ncbi:hypothetical protein [Comamonas sp. C24C]
MASTTIKFFHSALPGAPVLNGSAGSMLAVLDLLVTGMGLKSVDSMTVADEVATLAISTGHSFEPDTVALVAGASEPRLNGAARVIATTANTIRIPAPGVADGVVTGSMTAKLAPAGWEKVFSATNAGAYRSRDVAGTRMFVRLDDTGTTNARLRAYEDMTGINAAVGPTPLDSQVSGGFWWPKSGAANTTARPWFLVADERGFYLAVDPQGTGRFTVLYAGDIASFKSGDAWGFAVTGNQSDQVESTAVPDGCCGWSHRSARSGAYLVRSHTSIQGALPAQRIGSHHNGTLADGYAGTANYSLGAYPNGPNNGLMTGVLELYALGMRGTLPGLLHPVQDCGSAFTSGQKVAGTDDLLGRSLLALRVAPPSGAVAAGTVFLDIGGPWTR